MKRNHQYVWLLFAGAACHGFQTFPYCVQSGATGGQLKVFNVTCT